MLDFTVRTAHVGQELIIDREHYRRRPNCKRIRRVIYDSSLLLENPAGLLNDLKGTHTRLGGQVTEVKVFVFGPPQ